MCQIIGISNITGLTRQEINTIALKSKELVRSQKDGFGWCYATKPRNGKNHHNYYCEKYVDPINFKGIGSVGFSKRHLRSLTNAINMPMLSSGHPDAPNGGFLAHGRIATNSKNIVNTHPFRKRNWALVHNGVVDLAWDADDKEDVATLRDSGYNLKTLSKRYSTCDSEWLLNTYIHGKGHHDWQNLLEGYAATLSIAPDGTFIAAKDDSAPLFLSVIPELNNGAIIFGTAPHFANELARSIGLSCTPSFAINKCTAITISPLGKIKLEQFEPMCVVTNNIGFQKKSEKAFGWNSSKNKTSDTYARYERSSGGYRPHKADVIPSNPNESYWIKEKENLKQGDLL